MLRLLRNRTAQNTMEYALVLGIVVAVFSAMQLYFKRGMQARVKEGIDNVSEKVLSVSGVDTADQAKVNTLFGTAGDQYEPYYLSQGSSNMTTTSSEGTEKGTISETGGVRDLSGATTSRTGTQTITGVIEDEEDANSKEASNGSL